MEEYIEIKRVPMTGIFKFFRGKEKRYSNN